LDESDRSVRSPATAGDEVRSSILEKVVPICERR